MFVVVTFLGCLVSAAGASIVFEVLLLLLLLLRIVFGIVFVDATFRRGTNQANTGFDRLIVSPNPLFLEVVVTPPATAAAAASPLSLAGPTDVCSSEVGGGIKTTGSASWTPKSSVLAALTSTRLLRTPTTGRASAITGRKAR